VFLVPTVFLVPLLFLVFLVFLTVLMFLMVLAGRRRGLSTSSRKPASRCW
jgi:hypothetical protein